MNKCPRCENEKIKDDYKYCPMCGCKLVISNEEAIERLEDIILETKSFMDGEHDECFDRELLALEYAISVIKRTTQEVSVQEQLIKVTLDNREIVKSLAVRGKI